MASFPVAAQSEGTLDVSFNTTGFRFEDFGGGDDEATAVAVQLDGKIVSVGSALVSGSGFDFAIVRYNADGTLDGTFGTGGKVTTAIGPGTSSDFAYAVVIQPDGKIVVAGSADGISGSGTDFAVVRYNANGTLDTSFGGTGKVTTPFGSAISTDVATSLALQADGKIVAAGYADDVAGSGADFAIARYNSNGSLDTSFDADGKTTTAIGTGTLGDFGQAVVIQSDGKIVMAGWTEDASGLSIDFALARYNTNGSLDATFDGDGKVITSIGSSTALAFAAAVAIQADGKIIAVGSIDEEFLGVDFALVRYNTNGSLDTSFDTDGIVTTAIGPGTYFDFATSIVIQPDGKIIAAGYTDDIIAGVPLTDLALARYNVDGSLDTSFNADGKATIDLGGTEIINGAAIYSGNRIVVAGSSASNFLTARIWIATLTTAAPVTVSGRITDERGRGLKGASVTLTDSDGVSREASTNAFGYYRFNHVESDGHHLLRATDRGYTFAPPTRFVDTRDDVSNADFVGTKQKGKPNSPR